MSVLFQRRIDKNNILLKYIKEVLDDPIIIFGYGKSGKYIGNVICNEYKQVKLFYCDNSKKNPDGNISILSIEEAVANYKDAIFLITSKKYELQMTRQLEELGVNESKIVFAYTEELVDYLDSNYNPKAEEPLQELQFEINVVEHCNLKCKCCSQFSCICDEEYVDLGILEKDVKRLSELFDSKCKYIYLIGGEPFLHPKLISCMQICRDSFPKSDIYIFSNGLLVLKQSKEFWEACRTLKVGIIVTKYPVKIDYESIRKKCEQEQVTFEYAFGFSDEKKMINKCLDLGGGNDPKFSFTHCPEANNCIKLKDGKLYTCSVAPSIYKFNKYFNKTLPITKRDYVDIYKETTGDEILKKLARPIPFCKYCCKTTKAPIYDWGRTKGKIEEWCI